MIFSGVIKYFERGHASPTETFLKIFASDWDTGFIHAAINTVHKAGWTYNGLQAALDAGFEAVGVHPGFRDPLDGGIVAHLRSKVLFGMNVDEQHDLSAANNQVYSIEDGKLKRMAIDRSTNLPAPPLELNSRSGLIQWPTATNNGIIVTCLINPAIKVGGLIRLNERDIAQTQVPGGGTTIQGFPRLDSPPQFYARTTADGVYRVLVKEFFGDSRGNQWYMTLTCLAVDVTTAKSVLGAGTAP